MRPPTAAADRIKKAIDAELIYLTPVEAAEFLGELDDHVQEIKVEDSDLDADYEDVLGGDWEAE